MEAAQGTTFTDDPTKQDASALATDLRLEALISSATFSNMKLVDFKSTERPIYKSGSEPSSPPTGQLLWQTGLNTAANPHGVLLVFDGTRFHPVAEGFTGQNAGTDTVSRGDGVMKDVSAGPGGNPGYAIEISDDDSGGNPLSWLVGIAAQEIAVDNWGIIITRGFAILGSIAASPVRWGCLTMPGDGTKGQIKATSKLVTSGTIGRLLDTTNNICYLTGLLKA